MNITMGQEIILHKTEKGNICIKTKHTIYEYQLQGLRFLFKHWKSWHDNSQIQPSNYCALSSHQKGKSVTVILFLCSINALLHQSILILCKDDKEVQKWVFLLKEWTDFDSEEIAVNSKEALIKKKLFIKNCSELSSLSPFLRRSWSIVVGIGDDCATLPRFLCVDFTIWITSTDLSRNLSLLKSMHNWILPKIEFEMHSEIKPKWKNDILLHSVIRKYVFRSFYTTSVNHQDKEFTHVSASNHKRLKNKDTTGLKIKRSKTTTSRSKKLEIVDSSEYIETRNVKPVVSKFNEIDNIENVSNKNDESKNIATTTYISDIIDTNTAQLHSNLRKSSNIIEKALNGDEKCIDKKQICAERDDDELISKKACSSDDDNIEVNKLIEKVASTTDEENGTDIHLTNKSDLDIKLNQMQEMSMKKFKGTFLDSIFKG